MSDVARRAAEARMVDRCRITADPAGLTDATLDPDTGELTTDPATVIYQGPCLVSRDTRTADANPTPQGGQDRWPRQLQIRVPIRVHTIDLGHHVEILRCAADPTLTGRTLTITEAGDIPARGARIVTAVDHTRAARI